MLASGTTPRREKLDAALGLSWLRRVARRRPIEVPVVDFGSAAIVVVPAEAFVQYQLWAQQAAPKKNVMTLGYGECAPGYIPTNAAVAEGYADHYSWVDFATCEATLRTAIEEALASPIGRQQLVRGDRLRTFTYHRRLVQYSLAPGTRSSFRMVLKLPHSISMVC